MGYLETPNDGSRSGRRQVWAYVGNVRVWVASCHPLYSLCVVLLSPTTFYLCVLYVVLYLLPHSTYVLVCFMWYYIYQHFLPMLQYDMCGILLSTTFYLCSEVIYVVYLLSFSPYVAAQFMRYQVCLPLFSPYVPILFMWYYIRFHLLSIYVFYCGLCGIVISCYFLRLSQCYFQPVDVQKVTTTTTFESHIT